MSIEVSVIVPCRNERRYIAAFLDSLLRSDYPSGSLEVLVIDGMSNDGTRDVVSEYAAANERIALVDNPLGFVSNAMNIGIARAKGERIVRMDVHALYPVDYISKLDYYSKRLSAENVGGRLETLAGGSSAKAHAIAEVLSHGFGVGNSAYRVGGDKGEYIRADTVPFGCYPRWVFDKFGLYDEDLMRNQDNELNERIILGGGRIYLIPSLVIKYFARESFGKLWRMFYQYGYFGPLVDLKLGRRTRLRRYIPAMFVASVIVPVFLGSFNIYWALFGGGVLATYVLVDLLVSVGLTIRKRRLSLLPYLLFGFFVAHVSYGIGYWMGLLDFEIRHKHEKGGVRVETSR